MSGAQIVTDILLKTTPLDALHRELGAEMVEFAGFAMPLRYPAGIMAEHQQCRASAALFDVSHMGQVVLRGDKRIDDLEALVPGDIEALGPGRMRYSLFTNEQGGVIDDLMITQREGDLYIVVNASRVAVDLAHLEKHFLGSTQIELLTDRALLALQGPKAIDVISRLDARIRDMRFMSGGTLVLSGIECHVSRSGYTGEDGVEISVPAERAEELARQLLDQAEVEASGLGARDSLRLEAGFCLYGADLSETISPVEAGLSWTIGKRRKIEGGFLGSQAIMKQLFDGPETMRVGIRPSGRAPARAHTKILSGSGESIGEITSGGFGPTVSGPVAMGYVRADASRDGTLVGLEIRGRVHEAEVAPLSFVPKGWK